MSYPAIAVTMTRLSGGTAVVRLGFRWRSRRRRPNKREVMIMCQLAVSLAWIAHATVEVLNARTSFLAALELIPLAIWIIGYLAWLRAQRFWAEFEKRYGYVPDPRPAEWAVLAVSALMLCAFTALSL